MKIIRLLAICALMASLTSCATLFTSTKYPVTFNSTPNGAGITIENRAGVVVFRGNTPASVKLKSSAGYMKKEEYKVTFAKDGYVQKVVHISAELDGWYIGNILIGGWLGMLIVDPLSGAMYKIAKEDSEINEILEPVSKGDSEINEISGPVSNECALQVYDINHLPNGVNKDDLVRIN